MGKSRQFSIYLLKEGYDQTNSLREDHDLDAADADELPEGAVLYLLDSEAKTPWWKSYFALRKDIKQQMKGALIFLPVEDRCFALSFGHVVHHLDDHSYEYDFGLRVTLNSVDPNKLKSADMVSPGVARRKRTQVPISTELTYLDFDGNSEIIKSLTGKVKDEYSDIFKNATGSIALKVSLKLEPAEISDVCKTLLDLYKSKDFESSFPNIQNIYPVSDPNIVEELDCKLMASLKENDGSITLTIPDIIDYRDNTCCIFHGHGLRSDIYPDISLQEFYDFLGSDFDLQSMTLEQFKVFRMMLTDVDGGPGPSYSVYRSVIFDSNLEDDEHVYHLCEGKWYRIESAYIARLKTYLDGKCVDSDLPHYDHDTEREGKATYSEEKYNSAIPDWNNSFLCLDQTDISPAGSTQIEPCDIYRVVQDQSASCGFRAHLYHVKISTRSSHLSHLFNQGVNSVDLIQLEENSREKMKACVTEKLNGNDHDDYLKPLDGFDFKVIFGIISRKNKNEKSDNLPLFSKISLMRNMQELDVRKIQNVLMYIDDRSPEKQKHSKHDQIVVRVVLDGEGKKEIRAEADQGYDTDVAIKRCPKQVKESGLGSRFRMTVKKADDQTLSTHHSWPVEPLNQAG